MYKVIAVGGKVIDTMDSRMEAMVVASKFANENCTVAKVYCGSQLIAIFS